MKKDELLHTLNQLQQYAIGSKFYRFSKTPIRYVLGMWQRHVRYRVTGNGVLRTVSTFWGDSIQVMLPASMDIYLSGGKTHDSEIRLARFYIQHLNSNSDTMDIGAHIGYFSLLAAFIAPEGKAIAIEASPQTFSILLNNTSTLKNIIALNKAVSNQEGHIDFLQFPILFSEYNTFIQDQYTHEKWYKNNPAQKVQIQTITGSDIIRDYQITPAIIKIDVEGAEENVILGLLNYLSNHSPMIVMEFANAKRGNENHIRAEQHLRTVNYQPFIIKASGQLEPLMQHTSDYITSIQAESDNIVYKKTN